jgi:hypothetical protein
MLRAATSHGGSCAYGPCATFCTLDGLLIVIITLRGLPTHREIRTFSPALFQINWTLSLSRSSVQAQHADVRSPCAGFRDRVERPMMQREPRLCSELVWKELFLQPDELDGAGSGSVVPGPTPDPDSVLAWCGP